MIGASTRRILASTFAGRSRAARPRISAMLAMLEPTTLPTATSLAPESAASTDTTSSGALVPNATTVSPMASDETPRRMANADAPRISHSPPK
jgi:hypothetical protein